MSADLDFPADQFPSLSEEARARLFELQDSIARGGGRDAPVRHIFTLLGDRWSKLIFLILENCGELRYSELRRIIWKLAAQERPISQRMLTFRLRSLEADGLLDREVINEMPPHVVYRLSPLGEMLTREANKLIEWIMRHDHLFAAESRTDSSDEEDM